MSMGDFSNANVFFTTVMSEIKLSLIKNPIIPLDLLNHIFEKIETSELSAVNIQLLLFECCSILKQNNVRFICILDEFDAVRKYFGATDFHFLRKLSYNPDTAI